MPMMRGSCQPKWQRPPGGANSLLFSASSGSYARTISRVDHPRACNSLPQQRMSPTFFIRDGGRNAMPCTGGGRACAKTGSVLTRCRVPTDVVPTDVVTQGTLKSMRRKVGPKSKVWTWYDDTCSAPRFQTLPAFIFDVEVGMRSLASSGACLAWLLAAFNAMAQTPGAITNPGAPLVRQLEACFAKSIDVARTGDLDAYWRTRTAAAKTRPPALDGTRLRLLADLLPPLNSLQFVRLDSTGKMARALYRWRKEDIAQFTVVVYRMEGGEWKVDDFTVKRSGLSAPDNGLSPPQMRARTSPGLLTAPSSRSPVDLARVQELMRQENATVPAPQAALGGPKL